MDEIKDRLSEYFSEMFPSPKCELNYRNDFELLAAVILSAQTTDRRVNLVTEKLFKKYPNPKAFAQAEIKDIETLIKSIGLYKNKAKFLKGTAEILFEKFNGIVPYREQDLRKLPGVGRKTANVVLSVLFNKPAFPVDTHVKRVSKRLNIARESDTVLVIEEKLTALFPKETRQ